MNIWLLWTHCGHYHWTYVIMYSTYTGTGETNRYQYSFRVYGGYTNVVQLILEILPRGYQVFSLGVLAPQLPWSPARCVISLWAYSFESDDTLFLFGCIISHVRTYSKSQYLAVHSGLVSNTPGSLSRACAGPILNMVHRAPLVFNNLLSGLYAGVCWMGHILMYTNWTSLK